MISSRYALPVVLLIALAMVPTVIHTYLGSTMDDGMQVDAISPMLKEFDSKPADRNQSWGQDVFHSQDWIERVYRDLHGSTVRLFAARSFDHKRLYHHPELALSYGGNLSSEGMIMLQGEPQIPVHLLRSQSGSSVVAYALLYDGQFIDSPIAHQIRDSLNLLVNPRKAMTLFYVSSTEGAKNESFKESATALILREAIRSFRSQNPSVAGSRAIPDL